MKNSKLLTATAVFSVAITAAVTTMSLTAAYRGDSGQNMKQAFGQRAPQISEEQREAIHEALENKNYNAWLELAPENSRHSNLTETEFDEFAENQLKRIETMGERREGMEARRTAMNEVFENNDYEGWYELINENNRNPQILEVINAENFDKLVEIHNLRQEGQAKFEEAKALAEGLGIESVQKQGMRKGSFGGKHFNR